MPQRGNTIIVWGIALVIPHIFLESQLGVRRQSPWARQRPGTATPLFPSAQNYTRHDAKAVSTSYTRKLASDSATALQVNNLHIRPTTHSDIYSGPTSPRWVAVTIPRSVFSAAVTR